MPSIEQLHYVQSSTVQTYDERGQPARAVGRTATLRAVKYSADARRVSAGSAWRLSHSYTTCRKVQYRRKTSEDRQRVPSVAQLHYVHPSTVQTHDERGQASRAVDRTATLRAVKYSTDTQRASTGSAWRRSNSYTTCSHVQYRRITSRDRQRVPLVAQLHYV